MVGPWLGQERSRATRRVSIGPVTPTDRGHRRTPCGPLSNVAGEPAEQAAAMGVGRRQTLGRLPFEIGQLPGPLWPDRGGCVSEPPGQLPGGDLWVKLHAPG